MLKIPTIKQIRDQIINEIEQSIGQTVPSLPKAFYRIYATAVAGVVFLLYKFSAWNYEQIFPQTAQDEALQLIGSQYGIEKTPARKATLKIKATGEDTTVIPSGTIWQYTGRLYIQTDDEEITSGEAELTVESEGSGVGENVEPGEELSIASPLPGVDDKAEVIELLESGEDQESTEAYRQRILARLAQKPQGGAAPDYVSWALEVPGIVQAFAFRTAPGDVTVYPLQSLTGEERIPETEKVEEVEGYLNRSDKKPLCANVYAEKMTELVVNVNVTSLQPATLVVKDAVKQAWEEYLYSRYPLQYEDSANKVNAISKAAMFGEAAGAGVEHIEFDMTFEGEGSPFQHYVLDDDEIVKLGDLIWPV